MKKIAMAFFGLFIFNSLHSQTFNIQGNAFTGTTPVKYALVTFIDQSDTVKKFTTITDTLGNYHMSVPTAVDEKKLVLPSSIELAQNYPNPFSSSTAISYKLNRQSDVSIKIYDILGREVKVFQAGLQTVGLHSVQWDGKNNFGMNIANGVYFYQLRNGHETLVKKMIFNGSSITINTPISNGISFNQQKLQKKETKQIVTGIYSVRVTNIDTTSPPVIDQEFSNISIFSDTTLNFQLSEANDFALCYMKFYNNHWEIFLNNIKGTHPKNISNYTGDDEYPRWSPDGRYIVYSREGSLLVVYDVQNQTNTVLTSDTMQAGQNPFWTPNGKICFSYRGPYYTSPWEMFIMNPDGSNRQKIKINPSYYGVSLFYQDSYTCLYVDSNKVYKTNIDSTFNEFVFDLQQTLNQYVAIQGSNPNTEELLITPETTDSISTIATYNIKTKNLNIMLYAEQGYTFFQVKYSKDFLKIAFVEHSDNDEYLSVLEGGIKKRLIRIPASVPAIYFSYNPMEFSPDGRYLAFSEQVFHSGQWVSFSTPLFLVDIINTEVPMLEEEACCPSWNPNMP